MYKLTKKIKKLKIWWRGCILTNFYKNYFQNLKYDVKRACIFHLILVGILSILILPVKNRGVVFFPFNRQNPLSVTEVIC